MIVPELSQCPTPKLPVHGDCCCSVWLSVSRASPTTCGPFSHTADVAPHHPRVVCHYTMYCLHYNIIMYFLSWSDLHQYSYPPSVSTLYLLCAKMYLAMLHLVWNRTIRCDSSRHFAESKVDRVSEQIQEHGFRTTKCCFLGAHVISTVLSISVS